VLEAGTEAARGVDSLPGAGRWKSVADERLGPEPALELERGPLVELDPLSDVEDEPLVDPPGPDILDPNDRSISASRHRRTVTDIGTPDSTRTASNHSRTPLGTRTMI
jgi:hypothetical protein